MPTTVTTDEDGNISEVTLRSPKVIISYSRKLQSAPFEMMEASAIVEVDLDLEADEKERSAATLEAYAFAKVSVCEQLGLNYEIDAKTLIVRETLERHTGATEKVATTPTGKKAGGPPDEAALWSEVMAQPDRWFDNRTDKRNPKAPDFKRKGTGEGLWLDGRSTPPEAKAHFAA
jgi:hypothetical protein